MLCPLYRERVSRTLFLSLGGVSPPLSESCQGWKRWLDMKGPARCDEDCLISLGPVAALAALLLVRGLAYCCRAAETEPARFQARGARLLLLLSVAVGLGCAAAALLVEPLPGPPSWPPSDFAIGTAVAWALVWPAAALLTALEWHRGQRCAGSVWLACACTARVVPIIAGLVSHTAYHKPLPWLPAEAGLLAAALIVTSHSVRAAQQRSARLGGLLGAGSVEPLNAGGRAVPDESLDPAARAKEVAEDAAIARQRLEWMDEQKVHEKIAPDATSCVGSCAAFHKLHLELVDEAKTIQKANDNKKHGKKAADKDEGYTMSDSVRSLRMHLWNLCPKKPLFIGCICSICLTASSFGAPYAQGRLFDVAVDAYNKYHDGLPEGETWDHIFDEQVMPWLLVVGGLYFASWFFEIATGILFAVSAHTTLTRLRNRMFLNLVQQDIAFYDVHVSGELSSRLINDSGQLQGLAQFTTQQLLQAVVRLLGAVVAMYMTHPLLAVLATVISPLNYFIVRRAGYLSGLYGCVQNATLAKSNQVAVEALGAMRTVQANTGEVGEARVFARSINRFLRVVLVTVITQTVVIFTQLGLSKLRDVIVLGVGMWQVITGHGAGRLTIGSFTAFSTYVSLYEQGFSSMANIWINLRQVLVSAGRFLQLMDRRPGVVAGIGERPATCRGALELRDVTFYYPGATNMMVLEKMSFAAQPGQVVALVGESGAGKSTVGRLIMRFYDPNEGGLHLDGIDFRRLELRWLRQQIGLVEQEPTLFDRTITDNIRYGRPEASFAEVQRAARLANAETFITQLPEGFETKPGERGVRISGGQKQRIAIARAILKNPALLLLDEATSALDTANEAIVQAALDTLMEGKTTVVIAHRLSTVVRANQIIVLDKGRAIERGTHDELAAIPESRYSSFMRHQLLGKEGEAAASE